MGKDTADRGSSDSDANSLYLGLLMKCTYNMTNISHVHVIPYLLLFTTYGVRTT